MIIPIEIISYKEYLKTNKPRKLKAILIDDYFNFMCLVQQKEYFTYNEDFFIGGGICRTINLHDNFSYKTIWNFPFRDLIWKNQIDRILYAIAHEDFQIVCIDTYNRAVFFLRMIKRTGDTNDERNYIQNIFCDCFHTGYFNTF